MKKLVLFGVNKNEYVFGEVTTGNDFRVVGRLKCLFDKDDLLEFKQSILLEGCDEICCLNRIGNNLLVSSLMALFEDTEIKVYYYLDTIYQKFGFDTTFVIFPRILEKLIVCKEVTLPDELLIGKGSSSRTLLNLYNTDINCIDLNKVDLDFLEKVSIILRVRNLLSMLLNHSVLEFSEKDKINKSLLLIKCIQQSIINYLTVLNALSPKDSNCYTVLQWSNELNKFDFNTSLSLTDEMITSLNGIENEMPFTKVFIHGLATNLLPSPTFIDYLCRELCDNFLPSNTKYTDNFKAVKAMFWRLNGKGGENYNSDRFVWNYVTFLHYAKRDNSFCIIKDYDKEDFIIADSPSEIEYDCKKLRERLGKILQQFKDDETVKYSPNYGKRAKSKLTKTIKLLVDNSELNGISLSTLLEAQRKRDRYAKRDMMDFIFRQLEEYLK